MKNILYTIILSFLFSSSVFADYQAGNDAYMKGDYATALKEYRAAAEQGDARGQNGLGYMYYGGRGVTQDFKEALKWYQLAFEQGSVAAGHQVGVMYYKGQGVNQDIVIAYMWWYLAAENGNPDSKKNINILAKEMKPKQIAKAEKLARECIEKNYKDCG